MPIKGDIPKEWQNGGPRDFDVHFGTLTAGRAPGFTGACNCFFILSRLDGGKCPRLDGGKSPRLNGGKRLRLRVLVIRRSQLRQMWDACLSNHTLCLIRGCIHHPLTTRRHRQPNRNENRGSDSLHDSTPHGGKRKSQSRPQTPSRAQPARASLVSTSRLDIVTPPAPR
jgi:hypothetical protein